MTKRKIQYWVIPPKADGEFAACMEDVLETYALPYNLLSAHLDMIFSEFPTRVGLMDLAGVAMKGVAMRCGRLFPNDYMA